MKKIEELQFTRNDVKEFYYVEYKKVAGVVLLEDYFNYYEGTKERRIFEKGSVYLLNENTMIPKNRLGKTLLEIQEGKFEDVTPLTNTNEIIHSNDT